MRRKAMSQQKKESGKEKEGTNTEAQANVIANEGVMTMIGKKKPEKKAEKAMDAGSRAKRMLARKIHAKYVSGSTENVPDDIAEARLDEEGYDRMRDDRLVKYGIGHDGSDRKGSTSRPSGKQPKGDTVYQKEMKKKYGGKLPSALQVVTDKIREKHGKGAIHNAK